MKYLMYVVSLFQSRATATCKGASGRLAEPDDQAKLEYDNDKKTKGAYVV